MRQLLSIITFAAGVPAVLIWAVIAMSLLSTSVPPQPNPDVLGLSSSAIIASESNLLLPEIATHITTADSRVLILQKYLQRYNSPLHDHASEIVAAADEQGLDFRLLVAIGQQESNLCKRIPQDSFNCWGYGIYGDKVTRFSNYPEAISIISKSLKKNYIDRGLDTPEKIMQKYTPPSLATGGSWAKGVSQFMADME